MLANWLHAIVRNVSALPLRKLILKFYSDRDAQYASIAFQNLLKSCGVKQSFSPSGRPQHNAMMESFFSTLKITQEPTIAH